MSKYDNKVTKEQAAYIIFRMLPESNFEKINSISSIPDVDRNNAYRNQILKLYNAGIISGEDKYGLFNPEKNITRAEIAAIISNVIVPSQRKKVSLVPYTDVQSISLNYTEHKLYVNESFTLVATTLPEDASYKNVVWSSSNPQIATVSKNGEVKAFSRGTAVITAKEVMGEITASCTVTVDQWKKMSYSWKFNGSQWTHSLSIAMSSYEKYRAVDREKIRHNYAEYVKRKSDDKFMASVANSMKKAADEKGYTKLELANLIISFVQSLDYIYDKTSTGYDDYAKYPIETLYDRGGDCEDTSILLVSILRELGYNVVLLDLPSHVAVGIQISGVSGTYYFNTKKQDIKYYYVETTGEGWKIGQVPPKHKGESVKIIYLD